MSAEKKVAKSAERPAKKLGVSGDAKWGRSGWEPAEAPYERLVVAMANRAARKDDITFWIEPDASKPSTSAPPAQIVHWCAGARRLAIGVA